MTDRVKQFRGLRRNLEGHLLKEGELTAGSNMVSAEGVLSKRPGFIFAAWHLEPATNWPMSVFTLDLPKSDREGTGGDPNAPGPENGSRWGPIEPGDDPEIRPPVIVPGGFTINKRRFIVTLPDAIAQDVEFTLKIQAQKWMYGRWNWWVDDPDYTGGRAEWASYVYDDAGKLRRGVADLKFANGDVLSLDSESQWVDGVWEENVVLNDDGGKDKFKFIARIGWNDKGEDSCDIEAAPSSCPCGDNWSALANQEISECNGLVYEYVIPAGTIIYQTKYDSPDCTNLLVEQYYNKLLEDCHVTPQHEDSPCVWEGEAETEVPELQGDGYTTRTQTWSVSLEDDGWIVDTAGAYKALVKGAGDVPVGSYIGHGCVNIAGGDPYESKYYEGSGSVVEAT